MFDLKINLIEVSQLTAPTAVVLYGFWLATQGQIVLGTIIVLLALIVYLLMGRFLAEALKVAARAKVKEEDKKLKRVALSANIAEQKYHLQSNARKERVMQRVAEKIIDG